MRIIALCLAILIIATGELAARSLMARGQQGHQVMSDIANSMDQTAANAKFRDGATGERFRAMDAKLSRAMHTGVDLIPGEHRLYATVVRIVTWLIGLGVVFAFSVLHFSGRRNGAQSTNGNKL